jgi:hypothetical protein
LFKKFFARSLRFVQNVFIRVKELRSEVGSMKLCDVVLVVLMVFGEAQVRTS